LGAFHEDRRRDQLLQAAGWLVLRFTDRDVRRDPDHVEKIVGQVLARSTAAALGAAVRP